MSFANKVAYEHEKRTSLGDKNSAAARLISDDVAVCVRHNQNYARGLPQALPFAINFDNS